MSFAAPPPVNTSKVRVEDLPRIEELEAEDLKNYTKEQLAYYIEKHGVTPDTTKPKMKAQLREIMRDIKMQHPLSMLTPRRSHVPMGFSSPFSGGASFGTGPRDLGVSDAIRQAINQSRMTTLQHTYQSFSNSINNFNNNSTNVQQQQENDAHLEKERTEAERKIIKKTRKQSAHRTNQTQKLLSILFTDHLSEEDWDYGLHVMTTGSHPERAQNLLQIQEKVEELVNTFSEKR
eukprot:TRINITY_DN13095_c0_g1_i1.p1 TRINITY_DN13095_c0_g1~~TRINITY_DN13095_c0_g1_i1.p1  ORF type:complete len:241 (-),score=71.24 TRINITY_DN13095_c0_g1_i1:7-708(-)